MRFGTQFNAVVIASMLTAGAAHAGPTYFFGNAGTAGGILPSCSSPPQNTGNCGPAYAESLFLDAVAVTQSESFETRTVGALNGDAYQNSNQMNVFGVGNTLSQAAGTTNALTGKVSDQTGLGRFNTTPGATLAQWFETATSFTIDLATEVGALAFYGTDHGDFRGGLSIGLYSVDSNGKEIVVLSNAFTADSNGTALPTTGSNGALLFFGYASDAKFNRIRFNVTQTTAVDYLGFDDIRVGNLKSTGGNVPEPGSLALAGLALFAAGAARRATRRA
jgi:PEP-CTERM motif